MSHCNPGKNNKSKGSISNMPHYYKHSHTLTVFTRGAVGAECGKQVKKERKIKACEWQHKLQIKIIWARQSQSSRVGTDFSSDQTVY